MVTAVLVRQNRTEYSIYIHLKRDKYERVELRGLGVIRNEVQIGRQTQRELKHMASGHYEAGGTLYNAVEGN